MKLGMKIYLFVTIPAIGLNSSQLQVDTVVTDILLTKVIKESDFKTRQS